MQSFICSVDGDAWNSVLVGYKDPLIADAQGNLSPKVRSLWSPEELKKDTSNAKALNAIYNAIDVGQFRMISSYKTAKEVWEALETTYEGTSKVKQTKLIMLKSRFDSLLMQPDSSIAEFYKELRDIANESFALGKTYTEFDMVMKVLTSLPEKFAPKKTAMMESNDVSKMKLEELIGSLQTYEMEMKMQEQNRGLAERVRNLAFVSTETKSDEENEDVDVLTKKIGRFMKKLDMLKKDKQPQTSSSRFNKKENHNKDKRGIKCFECQGYGHLKADCANLQKRKEKSFKTTLSESETESDEEDVSYHNVISFVAEVEESVTSDSVITEAVETEVAKADEDASDDEDMTTYEELLQNFVTTCSQNVGLIKEKKELNLQVEDLKTQLQKKSEELVSTQQDLEETRKRVKMLTTGTEKLDHILNVGRTGHNPRGLGYLGKNVASKTANSKIVFVSGGVQDCANSSHQPTTVRRFVPICHHCGRSGHIRPRCYRYIQSMRRYAPYGYRQAWVRNDHIYCNVAYTSLTKLNEKSWYFDSGCSRHMTGDRSLLTDYRTYNGGYVTFGDGLKGKIIGRGSMVVEGLVTITNVLHVQDLKANLLSVGQICDSGFEMKFSKLRCEVYNKDTKLILTGNRTHNNSCYLLEQEVSCNKASIDNTILWHQKLGHIRFKNLIKLVDAEAVRGVPALK